MSEHALKLAQTQAGRLTIRPFAPGDQTDARRLIVQGLGQHFGFIDETLNPDLADIAAHYAEASFLVAVLDGQLVGAGALIRQADGAARVVRMSVDRRYRRMGVGTAILSRLLDHARSLCYRRVVLETNDDWGDAIAFYGASGFKETVRRPGAVAFSLDLQTAST